MDAIASTEVCFVGDLGTYAALQESAFEVRRGRFGSYSREPNLIIYGKIYTQICYKKFYKFRHVTPILHNMKFMYKFVARNKSGYPPRSNIKFDIWNLFLYTIFK